MMISLSRRFAFIANLKSASSAIEEVLYPISEVRLRRSDWGKHLSLIDVQRHFAWLLERVHRNDLFIFGVIRDPIDYMLSLRNSHADPKWKNSPELNADNMTFTQFRNEWVPRHKSQADPQCLRFRDKTGQIGVDYLISYSKLAEGWSYVCDRIGLSERPRLRKSNVTTTRQLTRADLTDEDIAWVEQAFTPDYDVLGSMCDRPLREEATQRAAVGRT
jgi:hypothetical protein